MCARPARRRRTAAPVAPTSLSGFLLAARRPRPPSRCSRLLSGSARRTTSSRFNGGPWRPRPTRPPRYTRAHGAAGQACISSHLSPRSVDLTGCFAVCADACLGVPQREGGLQPAQHADAGQLRTHVAAAAAGAAAAAQMEDDDDGHGGTATGARAGAATAEALLLLCKSPPAAPQVRSKGEADGYDDGAEAEGKEGRKEGERDG